MPSAVCLGICMGRCILKQFLGRFWFSSSSTPLQPCLGTTALLEGRQAVPSRGFSSTISFQHPAHATDTLARSVYCSPHVALLFECPIFLVPGGSPPSSPTILRWSHRHWDEPALSSGKSGLHSANWRLPCLAPLGCVWGFQRQRGHFPFQLPLQASI